MRSVFVFADSATAEENRIACQAWNAVCRAVKSQAAVEVRIARASLPAVRGHEIQSCFDRRPPIWYNQSRCICRRITQIGGDPMNRTAVNIFLAGLATVCLAATPAR
jgi:hypothetical protein